LSWPFDPTVYAGLLLLALGYAALARGRADVSLRQSLYFAAGLLTIWVALETPIDTASDHYLQSVHMLQHVLIGMVAPPLLLLALSPTMVATLLRLPGLRAATEPTFMAAGALFWWPVVGATSAAARWRLGEVGRVLYLLFGTVPADTVAVILLFGRSPFYPFYQQAPRLVPGIDPLTDQVLAGVVLMAVGKLSYLVAILEIFFRWLARVRAEEAAPEALASP